MGIKYLWTILTPFCERKPLYELQGKTVAIDLSCWICEAQNIADYQVQPRMYLRNLYFRTCYLLLLDVNPVFILEGKAPELKYKTIAARNAIQFKGAKPKTAEVKTGKDRSRFNYVLKRCEEMLSLMGLSCLTGKGEAESLCAYLNDEGLVDGCISQDSDCFAYGAKIVYRNFSIASQGSNKSSGGAVDIYDLTKAKEDMNFGRNKIIALALICGCDYNDGVQGIGKESVLKLFEDFTDEETLNKLRAWRKNPEVFVKYENMLSNKNICTSCGHLGKVRVHNQKGCVPCGMTSGCSDQTFKAERLKIKNELQIRSKALQDPDFPNETLINEYITKKDNVSKLDLKWKQPKLAEFVRFTSKYLQWEEIYAFEKILPILTRWQCLNYKCMENLKGIVHPSQIVKVRNPKGTPSYEVIWYDPSGYFKNLIPNEQIEESNTTLEKLWSTIEPQELVNEAYPMLVKAFQQSKCKHKKPARRRKKDNVEDIEEMLKNISISEPKPKKVRKVGTKKVEKENKELKDLQNSFSELKYTNSIQKPTMLEKFLKRTVLQSQTNNQIEYKDELIDVNQDKCFTSTPNKSQLNFDDEENDTDLSDIIENIICRKPHFKQNLIKACIKDTDSDFLTKRNNLDHIFSLDELHSGINELDENNSSNFFITCPVENDLFEKTFNEMYIREDENTIDYDYDLCDSDIENGDPIVKQTKNNSQNSSDRCINDNRKNDLEKNMELKKIEKIENESQNSFCENYVPLIERLNNKK